MLQKLLPVLKYAVAPFTGAWIEIADIHPQFALFFESHPSRVRGLKFEQYAAGATVGSRTLHGCVD